MLNVICERFNGTVLFKSPLPSHALSTDACTTGGAGFFMGDWFYSNWELDNPGFESEHINVKEVFAGSQKVVSPVAEQKCNCVCG
jgi:hypothetical protein